ncbi:hypothetical protein CLCHR_14560 [Clostridium chromiireducens]|uniref:HTH merR-type domain-containing protein n=1 Tax=Clostridium chromiireducens TaxID=225345 RepID=A0A1V4IUC3_9CLOT|nr:hypothetical protein CLCHR_14560 [Clostridium chromiireducens]
MFENEDITRLKKIQLLKDLGLTLDEIGQVTDFYFIDRRLLDGKRQVIQFLKSHIARAEEKINEINTFKMECQKNICRIEAIIKFSNSIGRYYIRCYTRSRNNAVYMMFCFCGGALGSWLGTFSEEYLDGLEHVVLE